MSLKSIEMQIALPRTQDASKMQEQIQARSQVQNELALNDVQKEVEQKRTTVTKQEQKDPAKWNQESNDKNDQSPKERKKQPEKKSSDHLPHPYKGKFIDVSG
jgi:hypothetical protein